MDKFQFMKSLSLAKANAEADMKLINQYALVELKPEDVFTYSAILCDNEVDRSVERFTIDCLKAMAELFVGKVGISDHDWSAENQIARIYRTEVVELEGNTQLGDKKVGLRGDLYMLRAGNEKQIAAIEGGILKEVSIAGSIGKRTCSICGGEITQSSFWEPPLCENGHRPGQPDKDGRLCVMELSEPGDAYEVSFVAVPCQPGAGVTKGFAPFEDFLKSDWTALGEENLKAIIGKATAALTLSDEEKEYRAELIKKYSKQTLEEK